MYLSTTLLVKCPMCGHLNKLDTKAQQYYLVENDKPFIMTCDMEEGGCDRYFVCKIVLTSNIHTYTYQDYVVKE